MPHRTWMCRGRNLQASGLPLMMGILNVTPDSFSDGGQYDSTAAAIQHAQQLIRDGADIIDVGGESTRPGADPVSAEEELRRTIPVIEAVASESEVPISIDTTKAIVAEQAVAAGASIINDISGLTMDERMLDVCRHTDAGICVMHIQGTPQTMQQNPVYEDVVLEVTQHLQRCLDRCDQAGISLDRICVDPGIGFGKTADHNLQLLRAVRVMQDCLQRSLLIGHSRKRFLSHILGRSVEERLAGTIGVSVGLAAQGVDVLRVHDVGAVRDALTAWAAVAEPPTSAAK